MPESTRTPRRVAITGASGLIGSALSQALRRRGDQVVHVVRRSPRGEVPDDLREVRWDPASGELDASSLRGVDAVVHLAGANVGDKRWTPEFKQLVYDSRVSSTTLISSAVASLSPPPRLVSSSAIGYYGDRGADVLTEDSQPGHGFVADLCRDWEAATWQAEQSGAPVVHARTGIVLSHEGREMSRLLRLARAGLAGPLGSGRQYWSWVTLHDTVRALTFLIDRPALSGPVNVTSPAPAPQSEVIKALGDQLNRPTLVPAPTIALRLALGQMAGEILGSRRVIPGVLTDAGFGFDHPDLDSAMSWLADRDSPS